MIDEPATQRTAKTLKTPAASPGRPSSLVDTRIIYCGDCFDQLHKVWHRFPTGVFNSNRNYEVFWSGRSEPLAEASGPLLPFEDRHAGTQAYIDTMRPRCVELARVLKKTGSFYYHSDFRVTLGSGRIVT